MTARQFRIDSGEIREWRRAYFVVAGGEGYDRSYFSRQNREALFDALASDPATRCTGTRWGPVNFERGGTPNRSAIWSWSPMRRPRTLDEDSFGLHGHYVYIKSLALSADGKRLVAISPVGQRLITAGGNGFVGVWDAANDDGLLLVLTACRQTQR